MKKTSAIFITFFFLTIFFAPAQEIEIEWKPREDLNISLPVSVQMFEGKGTLADGEPIRAFYATIDLTDENLKLRALGSNTHKQTTKEAYDQHDGILAINGGYFSGNTSVSLLISDGEVISPGLTHEVPRGAFGIVAGKPDVFWTRSKSANSEPLVSDYLSSSEVSEEMEANQAVGGGPVLVQDGEIEVYSEEEGFGGSHVLRHPRTAIGYCYENKLIMMVIDGRQKTSAGVTLPELAYLMKSLGAKEAVNLDGGGSSAMVAAGEVVNIPADIPGGNRNSLRRNASALVLIERQPSEDREVYYFDTESAFYSEKGIWKSSNHVNYYGKSPSRTASAETASNKAVYHFQKIPRKNYQLAVWWTVNPENSDQVAYILHHGRSTDTIFADQNELSDSGKWKVLGNYNLGPKDYLEIQGGNKGGSMNVDGIRLIADKNSPELPVRGDLRIAVISDLNSGLGAANYEWQVDSIISRIPRLWKPDLVISGGDMVAGMGISDTAHLRKMWNGFNEHIAKPLKRENIPFAFTLGNHDGPRSYPIEQKIAAEYWQEPQNHPDLEFVDKEFFPNYYSFTKGDYFFVSWEASSPEITEANLEWMEKQFAKPEAKEAKMRFVLGHMPLYSVAQERDSKGNVLDNPQKLQRFLEKYKVHTYISGHQHAYYPGKRGKLELLNTGAAGSGPRAWLSQERKPVNTITIMDIFEQQDSIAYHTYEIKEQHAKDMKLFEETTLPSAIFGVNGHILRRDIPIITKASGSFSTDFTEGFSEETGSGIVHAEIEGDKLFIHGNYSGLTGNLKKDGVALFRGRNTEKGEFLKPLKIEKKEDGKGHFKGNISAVSNLQELLSAGALYVSVTAQKGQLRAQLYPEVNQNPRSFEIISHNDQNIYGVRNLNALYKIDWEDAQDPDGDFIAYTYQLSKNANFEEISFETKTGRTSELKRTEKDWFKLLKNEPEGSPKVFYHRVLAHDGKNITASPVQKFQLMKSGAPLADLIEIEAPRYIFAGKVENAAGAGYGAEWDHEGKLWLADYGGSLIIKNQDGSEAPFSPITQVEIGGTIYDLSPLNGIGIDADGNILAARNRHLLKIDASTGRGMAVWEVPEGERAITSPRATQKGEIYAMSLFSDDPNYVLKRSSADPESFELLRTIELKDRILSRSFDMSEDGKTLYFPDPGSPVIQKYISEDGVTYKKENDISSTASGSSAIHVENMDTFFAAVRSSGISPSTFHYRNGKEQQMWTLELPEVNGAEPRGIGVSPDEKTLIFCSWDKGGGYYMYKME